VYECEIGNSVKIYIVMKKLTVSTIVLLTILLITGCGGKDIGTKTKLERYTENLIQLYPNFATNEMAKKSINDSIAVMSKNAIGKDAILLDSVAFKFDGLREGKYGKCALFVAEPFMFIDNLNKNSNDKSIAVTINISAFGSVDDNIASKLDGNKKYFIKGKIHSIDLKNFLNVYYVSSFDALNLGTYILDDMSISEIPQD
jgi:hypothetical protein